MQGQPSLQHVPVLSSILILEKGRVASKNACQRGVKHVPVLSSILILEKGRVALENAKNDVARTCQRGVKVPSVKQGCPGLCCL